MSHETHGNGRRAPRGKLGTAVVLSLLAAGLCLTGSTARAQEDTAAEGTPEAERRASDTSTATPASGENEAPASASGEAQASATRRLRVGLPDPRRNTVLTPFQRGAQGGPDGEERTGDAADIGPTASPLTLRDVGSGLTLAPAGKEPVEMDPTRAPVPTETDPLLPLSGKGFPAPLACMPGADCPAGGAGTPAGETEPGAGGRDARGAGPRGEPAAGPTRERRPGTNPRRPTEPGGSAGPATQTGPTEPARAVCEDGQIRPVAGAATTTCTWVLPAGDPEIEFISATDNGRYAVPGAEGFFTKLKYLFKGLPGNGGKVARLGARVGEAASAAAKRWAEGNASKLGDVVLTVPRIRVSVECRAVEICVRGRWQPGSQKVKESQTRIAPLERRAPNVLGRELERALFKLQRDPLVQKIYKDQAAYESDPCRCAGSGKGARVSTPAAGGGPSVGARKPPAAAGRNCQPTLDRLRATEQALEDARAQRAKEKAGLAQAEHTRGALVLERGLPQARLDAALKALAAARAALDTAMATERDVLEQVKRGGSVDPAFLDRVAKATDKRQARVKQAEAAAARARETLEELDGKIRDLDRRIRESRDAIRELEGRIQGLEADAGRLRAEYERCLRQR